MEALGFDQYSQLMKIYLQRFKEITKSDKGMIGASQLAFENAYQNATLPLGYEAMIPQQPHDAANYGYPANPSNHWDKNDRYDYYKEENKCIM